MPAEPQRHLFSLPPLIRAGCRERNVGRGRWVQLDLVVESQLHDYGGGEIVHGYIGYILSNAREQKYRGISNGA